MTKKKGKNNDVNRSTYRVELFMNLTEFIFLMNFFRVDDLEALEVFVGIFLNSKTNKSNFCHF